MTVAARELNTIDHPGEYMNLTPKQRGIIQDWIKREVEPYKIKTFRGVSSYALKHVFEESEGGFYITNGQFKGSLDAAGYEPKDRNVKNWEYALSWKALKF